MLHKTLFLLFFLTALKLSAQTTTIKSFDPLIRYDLLRPVHTFQKVTAYDSTGAITTVIINESLVKIDSSNHQIIFIRTRQFPPSRLLIDTSIISLNGPIRYHMNSLPLNIEVKAQFGKQTIDAEGLRKGVKKVKKTEMTIGYFDDNIVEELAGFLPITPGKKYHLEAFRYESENGINPYDIEYVFDDVLKTTAEGSVHCRVLHYINGYTSGYIWIDKRTNLFKKEVLYLGKSVDLIEVI